MRFNRKLFWRTLALLTLVESLMLLTACADWESQVSNIISLAGPAITAILNILAALGVAVSPTFMAAYENWANQAQQALTEIQSLVAQYKAAAADAQAGILSNIQTALSTVANNLTAILPELHIDNPTKQGQISAALQAVMGFFTAILNLVPALKPQLSESEAKALHTQAQDAVKVFRTEFNDAVKPFESELHGHYQI